MAMRKPGRSIRYAATLVSFTALLATLTTGTAHAAIKDYKCKTSSKASATDKGGRDAVATSRDAKNSKKFFRIEFISDGEHMYAENISEFNLVEYRASFQGTGKTWYWNLRPNKTVHDNLDLPEGHETQINAIPTVPGFNCGTNGART
ncbi:hypothetical protein [Streptomyces albidoflavus]|uniref:hypothetical protein n=1 Tax=Streptomyces albidoflavus TaxID=1886 RepID=UPI00102253FD|nr:hypothetical protein [Streptomyces albidoflavus]